MLLAALAALTLAVYAGGWLLDLDLALRDWAESHRPAVAAAIATGLNKLGQGGMVLVPLATLLAGAAAWRLRSVRPLLVVVVAFVLSLGTIAPMKAWADRGFPRNWELAHPEELFSDPVGGQAYPSGHVANAVLWFAVIALLLRLCCRLYGRREPTTAELRLLRVAPVVIVFCTTTYLSHHWITDSVAGLLLGLLLDRLFHRVLRAVPAPVWGGAALSHPDPVPHHALDP